MIAGHVDSRLGPGIFSRLDELAVGDLLEVRRADGSVVAFVVQSVETFAKRNFPTEAVYVGDGATSLRLITCGGGFNETTRHYDDNVVAFASLAVADKPGGGNSEARRSDREDGKRVKARRSDRRPPAPDRRG